MRSAKVLHAETTRKNIQPNFTTCKTPRKKKHKALKTIENKTTKFEQNKLDKTTKKNPKLSSLETC